MSKERVIRVNRPEDIVPALASVAYVARRKEFDFRMDEETMDFIIPVKQWSSVSRRLRRREITFQRLHGRMEHK